MTTKILLSGFGGQGILFAGKQLAGFAMHSDYQVTWLPSYGPEMRGGAANCSVIISDREIGAPQVSFPDVLIALNLPSFDKFEPKVTPGGLLIADSTLIPKATERTDIRAAYIPATGLASENGLDGLANVIMLGKLLKERAIFDFDKFCNYMANSIPASRASLIEKNQKALSIGYNYK
ncbi:MAG: 2-oxoacid:ferredoxin oxidoreductase subunit gamma [Clostridiales bacterium]|nr:2-oxoacid:ferredoxin oxidoreductase subunit gamma [Clostridiales bacterium]